MTDDELREYEVLIREAHQWATGATIHDVNGLIGAIQAGVEYFKAKRGHYPEAADDLRRHAKTLREFMAHGDYKRARRENPF